jgi:hypothetical protein
LEEGKKNNGLATWTGELVIHCLEEAFRAKPDAAMFSMEGVSDLPSDSSIEGIQLIKATALALGLDTRARIHILYHARSRSVGEPINKLCANQSWKGGTHYWQLTDASIAVAEWLNARAMQAPELTDNFQASAKRRGVGRPPTLGSKPMRRYRSGKKLTKFHHVPTLAPSKG